MLNKAFKFTNKIFQGVNRFYTILGRIIILPWILFIMLIVKGYKFVFEEDA